jgi:hypothetical protein
MPNETARRYLDVVIDRATGWVFVRIYPDLEIDSALAFVNRLYKTAPMGIDNGACLTDRFQRKSRTPSGKHRFDPLCGNLASSTGMVERFNGRIADVLTCAVQPETVYCFDCREISINRQGCDIA